MSAVTEQNASSSEELAATAEEMMSQSHALRQLMEFFVVDGRGATASVPAPRPAGRRVGALPPVPAQSGTGFGAPVPAREVVFDEDKFERF